MNRLKRATIVTFVAGLGLFLATTSAAAQRTNELGGTAVNVTGQTGEQDQSGDLGEVQIGQTGDQGQSGDLGAKQLGQTGDQGQSGEVSGPNDGAQGQSGESN